MSGSSPLELLEELESLLSHTGFKKILFKTKTQRLSF
jgi:hypothetical protein